MTSATPELQELVFNVTGAFPILEIMLKRTKLDELVELK